jgi:serine palmitoyltransferase
VSRVIPAFSKRGDVIIADEMANDAIISGMKVSRSYVYYFKHNDMEDLERLLAEAEDKHGSRNFSRRFIVTESLFQRSGKYADLKAIINIKKKFKYRLIVDNSIGLGTTGPYCNGLNCENSKDIDIIVGSLANVVGGAGGYCAGDSAVVDHQVLFIF